MEKMRISKKCLESVSGRTNLEYLALDGDNIKMDLGAWIFLAHNTDQCHICEHAITLRVPLGGKVTR